METKILLGIVAYSSLLLVQGLDSKSSYKNGTVDSSRRIINGEMADPADFRFLVLTATILEHMMLLCGGSVISHHFILTAGHCLYNRTCTSIEIFPSTWVFGDRSDLHPINCYPHDLSDGRDYYYDIGLLRTGVDLLADRRFAKIDLPPPGMIYGPGDEGVIAGWGRLEDGSQPKNLMRAVLPVYSWDECNRAYEVAKDCADNMICPVSRIPDHVFCTLGKPPMFPGPCLGDSGGPVIIDGMLAGVISGIILSDRQHCIAGTPGLNQDVSQFIPWIHYHIRFDRGRSHIPVVNKYS